MHGILISGGADDATRDDDARDDATQDNNALDTPRASEDNGTRRPLPCTPPRPGQTGKDRRGETMTEGKV